MASRPCTHCRASAATCTTIPPPRSRCAPADTSSYGLSWRTLPRSVLIGLRYLLFRERPARQQRVRGEWLRALAPRSSTGPTCRSSSCRRTATPAVTGCRWATATASSSSALRPVSRGSVTLAGPDPHLAPVIDFNFLADARDMDVLVAGLRARPPDPRPRRRSRRSTAARTARGRPSRRAPTSRRTSAARWSRCTIRAGTCRIGDVVDTNLQACWASRACASSTAR